LRVGVFGFGSFGAAGLRFRAAGFFGSVMNLFQREEGNGTECDVRD
jgi:hypothetical protein